MSKPIFIIRIPYNDATKDNLSNITRHMSDIKRMLSDYHVISLIESGIERVEFECHNAVDVDDIEIEEITDLVTSSLEKFNSASENLNLDEDE